KAIIRNCITLSFVTTILAQQILELAWTDTGVALQSLLTAGDRLSVYPTREYPFKLYNLYGPTEDSVWTTWTVVEKRKEGDPLYPTIGKPIKNHQVYIKNRHLTLQPVGVPGELCIAGNSLAIGYLNKPELTAERFVKVSGQLDNQLYRTGDLGRWLPDGNIEFLGRIDHQVKIRGFRIELGEIESRLTKHPDVSAAVVITVPESNGETVLCAYYATGETAVGEKEIREHLVETLPSYMVPTYFTAMEQLPVTATGKVDRKALPEPFLQGDREDIQPCNATEKQLLQICREILESEDLGMADNFFRMGGNSLKTLKLAAGIEKAFGITFPVVQLFKTPVIRDIANYIQGSKYKNSQEEIVTPFNPGKPSNIFCFPPAVGYGISYLELANHLDNHTLYGFNYIDETGIMEKYVNTIMEIQPEGPYVLLGYSAGGRLCLKCAEALEKKGKDVSEIIILDSYSQREELEAQKLEELEREFNDRLIAGMKRMGLESMVDKVMETMDKYRDYHDSLIDLQPVKAAIHLIKAGETAVERECLGWEAYTAAAYREYEGAGKHSDMLAPGYIETNASKISGLLEKPELPGLTEEIKANHKQLSATGLRYLEYAARNPEVLKRSTFEKTLSRYVEGANKFQGWPTFINREMRKQMEDATIATCTLIKSIPERIFGNDIDALSSYYGIPVNMVKTQLSVMDGNHVDNLLARGDFSLSATGFKCLEYNISSTIGGLELPFWEALYMENPQNAAFLEETGIEVENKNLLTLFLEHLVKATDERFNRQEETGRKYNIVMASEAAHDLTDFETAVNRLYRRIYPGETGGAVYLCSYSDLEIKENNLFYKKNEIDILIENYMGAVPAELLELFKNGRINLFNGPITGIMSNKLNLALLSEAADREDMKGFTEKEKELITKYIPWSRKAEKGKTIHQGETVDLETFMRQNRTQLILKPAIGTKGEGVVIGKSVSQEEWEQLVDRVLAGGNWLVQEYIETLPLMYQLGQGCDLHEAVWGLFAFGENYGGGFLRVMPVEGSSGVINTAQGARLSILFEVKE
ncbi:MAG: AMP-binding protein, partial [bacterium]|nr:AMP-binding protein [bacterium]